MKKLTRWTLAAALLMFGGPWLAIIGPDTCGMGAFILLFFIINPIFVVICSTFAGKRIKELWSLPLIVTGLYLAGAWLILDMGQTDFFFYCGIYLAIGILSMLTSAWISKRRTRNISE